MPGGGAEAGAKSVQVVVGTGRGGCGGYAYGGLGGGTDGGGVGYGRDGGGCRLSRGGILYQA